MKDNFFILCCENIRQEVDAVISKGTLPNAIIHTFPFHCGHVKSVWKLLSSEYNELKKTGGWIFLCGCGCSNKIDIPMKVRKGDSLIFTGAGASLFLPEDMVVDLQRKGSMVILPGWLSHWKDNIRCNRLDKKTARQMYGESIKEIVLVDSGVHSGVEKDLKEFSEFIGLPSRSIPAGIEHFSLRLNLEYQKWQLGEDKAELIDRISTSDRRVADYSMVADLTAKIIGVRDENTIISRILDLMVVLCSPKKAGFLPLKDNKAGTVISVPSGSYSEGEIEVPSSNHPEDYQITDSGDGFRFRAIYNKHLIGVVAIDEVLMPEYLDEYINITHFISQIGGLSITIARTYQDLVKTVEERDAEILERRNIEEALRQANKKLNMLSSITRHDILNQIMGIRGYLELSKNIVNDPKLRKYIDIEGNAVDRIQKQIEFTRYYQDIGVEEPKWQNVEDIVNITAGNLDLKEITVKIALSGIIIFADPLIEKVFYNLMENSLRHGEHVSKISFSYSETDKGLVISYRDDGIGISEDDRKRLFERGFGKHTGLGLFLSREILSITGIAIEETGEHEKGVNFEMTAPKGGYRLS